MKYNILKIVLTTAVLLFIIAPQVLALELVNPLRSANFKQLVDTITNFVTIVAVAVAPIFIIYAGFLFMGSGGEPGKVKTATQVITYTLGGLAILLLSKALIMVLMNVLGVKTTTGQ